MVDKEEIKPKQKQYNEGKISIMIGLDTHKKLTNLKIHPKQSYAEVVKELVDNAKPKKR